MSPLPSAPARDKALHRTQLLLGAEAMARLASLKVVLFGAGGVGSWTAEALVRTGVGALTIVDADLICPTNVNRQAQATSLNVGKPKAEELRKRLLEIAPGAGVEAVMRMYDASTCDGFDLASYDYVLDAIDTLSCKILLLKRALAAGTKVFASMGAASRLDPTRIRVASIAETKGCPLARVVRQGLKKEGVDASKILCVYSEEPVAPNKGSSFCGGSACVCPDNGGENLCAMKAKINGSLVQATAPFGFALASLLVNDAIAGL